MRRVHPSLIVALLQRRVQEFGPITKANSREVTSWLLGQLDAGKEAPVKDAKAKAARSEE
jgi:hypothetical protein